MYRRSLSLFIFIAVAGIPLVLSADRGGPNLYDRQPSQVLQHNPTSPYTSSYYYSMPGGYYYYNTPARTSSYQQQSYPQYSNDYYDQNYNYYSDYPQ